MRRGYQVEDYLSRISTIKNARRRLALTSDIIVGFPGETSEDFKRTMELVEACQYDSLYIFKYSERPGTPAARLAGPEPRRRVVRQIAGDRLPCRGFGRSADGSADVLGWAIPQQHGPGYVRSLRAHIGEVGAKHDALGAEDLDGAAQCGRRVVHRVVVEPSEPLLRALAQAAVGVVGQPAPHERFTCELTLCHESLR